MGCKLSKAMSVRHSSKTSCLERKNDIIADTIPKIENKNDFKSLNESPVLSTDQKDLISNTWVLLVDNVSKVGVITFMSLFETHPDVQNVFNAFRGMGSEELKYSKELRAHALRVMGFVQKVVARINEPEKCEQLLCDLGKKHVNYGAKKDYIDLVGPQFIYAIKPSLESQWSDDIENAWIQLFIYMGFHIKIGMSEAFVSLRNRTSRESLLESSKVSSASKVDKKH